MLCLPLLVGPAYVQNSGDEKNFDLQPNERSICSCPLTVWGLSVENSRILTTSTNKIGAFGSSETEIIRTNW